MTDDIDVMKCRVEKVHLDEWDEIISLFDDANIYQTAAYAKVCYKDQEVDTIVIRKGKEPIGAALVVIRKVPLLPFGIAYIRWGPLWQSDGNKDIGKLHKVIEALKQEYVMRRGLVLRIRPFLYDDELFTDYYKSFQNYGFKKLSRWPRKQTLLVDLQKPLKDLRKGLNGKWRNHLNRAEKNELTVIAGHEELHFERFNPIHTELNQQKNITGTKSIDVFQRIQAKLTKNTKMRIFLCCHEDEVCGGIIVSAIGSTGITLARATSAAGRRNKAAYLLHWNALKWLKEEGCKIYDLSGINKENNPGTYSYKKGFCGKNGIENYMLDQYQACKNKLNQWLMNIVDYGALELRRKF